jgi:flagella basal body P-ring formation protein FlgA
MAQMKQLWKRLLAGTPGRAAIFGAAMIFCGPARGQVIRLNPRTQVAQRQDVRLGDIATVTAPDARTAEELASTVIITGVEHSETIKAETVLLALLAQHGPASVAGNLQISGAAACEIKVQGSPDAQLAQKQIAVANAVTGDASPQSKEDGKATPTAEPPAATGQAAQMSAPATMPAASETITLAKLIVSRAQSDLNSTADDVRVTFETISPLLDQPVPAGRRWLCRPLTRMPLGTVQYEAQLVEGTKVVERLTVQTKVEKKQMVVVATGKFVRGDLVTPDKMRLQEAWMDRRIPTLICSMADAAGLEAQKEVEIGSMLDQRDFKPLLMAHRNDTVNVIYIAGPLEVQMSGQVMTDAKLKDQVEIRNPKTGEQYSATMVAKGIAVAGGTLTAEQESKLRESR